MQQQSVRAALLILISSVALGACSTSKEKLLPQDGATMLEIYEGHLDRAGRNVVRPGGTQQTDCEDSGDCATPAAPNLLQARAELAARSADRQHFELVGYTRQVHNEIEVLFPTLPNPTLVMYVFPHLAGEEQMPVPGYATSFSMYSKTEFALPGEVSQQGLEHMNNKQPKQPLSPLEAGILKLRPLLLPLTSEQ